MIHSCLILNDKGKVYGLGGDVGKGQLGFKPNVPGGRSDSWGKYSFDKATLNKQLKNIINISCGYSDSLCIDSKMICYVFGSTAFAKFKQGQQNNNSYYGGYYNNRRVRDADFYEPYKFAFEFIKDGCCGFNHTALLTINNEVVIFGEKIANYHRGFDKITKRDIGIPDSETIEKVVAGYENTIVICA